MKLYEIAAEYRAIDAAIDETGGEITPEIEAALAALEGTLEDKVDAICGLIREALADAEGYSSEITRLTAHRDAAYRRWSRLKTWLLLNMKAMGRDRVKGARFSARVARASQAAIRWVSEDPIPPAFRRTVVELDAAAAREALKRGELPDGFRVERSEYLDIR